MKRLWLTLVLGSIPAVGWSQLTGTPSGVTRNGQVVDSVSGQPIARALVQGQHGTLTDHDGRFTVEGAAVASKPGYFPEDSGSFGEDGAMVLRLTPEAILYGTVTDTNAQPIQQLQVQLRHQQVRAGLAHWEQMQGTQTNAEGEFRFAQLPAGRYSLSTGYMVDGLYDAASSLAFVPLLYPPPGPDGGDGAVTLRAGDHVEANLSPAGEKLYPVSGVVQSSIARGVSLSVETREGLPVNAPMRYFPDSGIFRLRLPSGWYRLQTRAQVEMQQFAGTREILVGPAGLEGVSVGLALLPSIPVEVEYQQSNSSRQEATVPPSFTNLSLTADDPGAAFNMLMAQVAVEGDGHRVPQAGDPMVIRDVPPGHYVLQAQVPAPWYVASATCGNVDLRREPLVVTSGSGACSMRLVFRDDSATLRWSVAHSSGRLAVMAFPLGDLTQSVGGANERFGSGGGPIASSMSGLAPGRYLVVAGAHGIDVPYREPEALAKYLGWGKEVTLAANGEAEIELEVAPGEP